MVSSETKVSVTFTNVRDFVITLCDIYIVTRDQATASILRPRGYMSMAPLSPLFSAASNELVLVCEAAVHSMGGDQQQMMWHLQ